MCMNPPDPHSTATYAMTVFSSDHMEFLTIEDFVLQACLAFASSSSNTSHQMMAVLMSQIQNIRLANASQSHKVIIYRQTQL